MLVAGGLIGIAFRPADQNLQVQTLNLSSSACIRKVLQVHSVMLIGCQCMRSNVAGNAAEDRRQAPGVAGVYAGIYT